MEHPVPISIPREQKARSPRRPGLVIYDLRLRRPAGRQPRVRERIMKLSKVYSATCHQRYSSDR